MFEINGDHPVGYSDGDVKTLRTPNSTVKVFPSEFPLKFNNLTGIYLENVSVEVFNEPFENCQNLTTISIQKSLIEAFPTGVFADCKELVSLSFDDTEISFFSDFAFGGLKGLKRFSLMNSKVSKFPANISPHLSNLEFLRLSGNFLETFEMEFLWKFPELHTLYLDNNNISSITSTSFRLNENLQELFLDGNSLKFSNEQTSKRIFENLKALKFLSIKNNELEVLPAFTGLDNLKEFDLSSNFLRTLPWNSYKLLTSLNTLKLNNNQMSLNADFLQFYHNISSLQLQSNQISTIDDRAFDKLKDLIELDLSYNNLTKLEANKFKNLSNMTTLDVSYNQIDEIERKIFKVCPNLLMFRASGNKCVNKTILIFGEQTIDRELGQCFNKSNSLLARWFVLTGAMLLLIVNQVL